MKEQATASASPTAEGSKRSKKRASSEKAKSPVAVDSEGEDCKFLGYPVPDAEARKRWPHRYQKDPSTVHSFCLYASAAIQASYRWILLNYANLRAFQSSCLGLISFLDILIADTCFFFFLF